jgi:PTS system nitrogen regulatory IIA component
MTLYTNVTSESLRDILTIKQLSEYLMVSEKTIYRMLEKNSLPAIRVGGQWRFRKRDIDTWIDNQVKKVEVEGDHQVLAELQQSEINLAPLINEENVWLNLPSMTRNEILRWMVFHAKLQDGVDRETLSESVRVREEICSTALVNQAAFPHPNETEKFGFSQKRVLVAVTREPVDFLDPHGHHPRIIVMILARSMQGYLLAISRAIKLFSDVELVDRITESKTPGEVIRSIREAEEGLRTL